jgi:hypothetical protein
MLVGTVETTIVLPSAVGNSGKMMTIKADAGGDDVTLSTVGGETIDGSSPPVLSEYESITVFSDGTDWLIGAYYIPAL